MSPAGLTVLVLGGYGTFGGRLVRRLAGEPRLQLIVAGRSGAKAQAFIASLPDGSAAHPIAVDRDRDLAAQIGALRPDLLIDATGPFQRSDPGRYAVVEACLALGIHYADLADATDFVLGIRRFDADALAKSLVVVSGLSTCPAFSSAVVQDLSASFAQIDGIVVAIAPSPRAGLGLNVIRAIASYAGKPIESLQHGRRDRRFGLMDSRRLTIAPPGRVPLTSRVFSLVDLPDLQLLPDRYAGMGSVWAGAGTEPVVLHRGLIAMAALVRAGLLPSLLPFAGLFWQVTRRLRWGEDRGGFLVSVSGRLRDGREGERSFHLLAERGDGPMIPCLAAEALIRGALAGRWPAPGARPASDVVPLQDFLPLLSSLEVATGYRSRSAETAAWPIYRQVLGDTWEELPAAVRALHGGAGTERFAGFAKVDRGDGLLARLMAAGIGFPVAGHKIPVAVTFERRDGRETWCRNFVGRRFASRQAVGHGRFAHLVVERFGPVAVGLALVVDGHLLRIVVRRWSVFGVPLPLWLAPGGNTFESEDDRGRFQFHVEIKAPLIGLIVRYRGWLTPST